VLDPSVLLGVGYDRQVLRRALRAHIAEPWWVGSRSLRGSTGRCL
jgi:hypothetical protein